ncbi:MAG: phospholipase [Devosia sp.]
MHNQPVIEKLVGRPRLTVVLVHGRTLTPAYMDALAERLALEHVRYLFPAAEGNSWYPKTLFAPLADNEPGLDAAIAHYETLIAGLLATGTPLECIVVGGFSQGACLTAEFLSRHPRRFGAAILWTGGAIGPPGRTWPPRPALAGLPVYLTTSKVDPFVPASRVIETADWLTASGALPEMEIFENREHMVSDREIERARQMLVALAPGG